MPLVSELTLRDFRGYQQAVIHLQKPGLHLVWGRNGQGKTSLLEALHFGAFLRSFRTSLVAEMVREKAECFEIAVRLTDPAGSLDGDRLFIRMGKDKTLRRNGRDIRRASEFINAFVCIALVPEDVDLIAGAPGRRRQFMDMLLTQLDHQHLVHLAAYREALRSRNALFRRGQSPDAPAAAAFAGILARHGAAITRARAQLAVQINDMLAAHAPDIGDKSTAAVRIEYKPNCRIQNNNNDEEAAQELKHHIDRNWDRDTRQGCTTTGPHRDDLAVWFEAHSVTTYGSQGERRLSGILLKLASLHLVNQIYAGRRPILLLIDDVLGDLDAERRLGFLNSLHGADQTVLVQTGPPDSTNLPSEPAAIHHVADRTVTSQL